MTDARTPGDLFSIEGSLNDEQLAAATAGPGAALVSAGPGSGKTRVITFRVLHLVAREGVPPERILAMTFTNKAAGEMRRRLESFLGDGARRLWVGTFHATCARLLRIHHAAAGVAPDFCILDEEDQVKLIGKLLRERFGPQLAAGLVPKPSVVRGMIDRAKRREERAATPPEDAGEKEKLFAAVMALYERALAERGALDFSDLVLRTVLMLRRDEAVREALARRFLHVLVDEFQDTDPLQYEMARTLAGAHGNLFAVGDEDQAIYGWRGARVENILHFRRDFPACGVYKLQRNYRSTAAILRAASAVISRNERRIGKELWTEGEGGEPVRHLQLASERDEALAVTREVDRFRRAGGGPGEAAVIYRTHAQSRAIEEAMVDRGIPYRIVGGVRFFERAEIKDLLAFLRLATMPADDTSFLRVVNVPPRGLGEAAVAKVEEVARERGASLLDAAAAAAAESLLPRGKAEALGGLTAMIGRWRAAAPGMTASAMLERIVRETRYEEHLRASGTPQEAEGRIENVEELAGHLTEFEENNPGAAAALFFDQVSLHTSVDALEEGAEKVTLMTAHSAKGLEFDLVIVTGVEDGLFPHRRAGDFELPDGVRETKEEEECRLLYVAMTRARKRLVLMSSVSRKRLGGQERYVSESPFLRGVSPLVIERVHARPRWEEREDDERAAAPRRPAPARPPARQTPPPKEQEAAGKFRVGDTVRHSKFGGGRVVDVSGEGNKKVTVRLGSGSVKTILEDFLEKT